jgi:peptidoglycan hydrolase-like protein with peptidoglycan-binding domain
MKVLVRALLCLVLASTLARADMVVAEAQEKLLARGYYHGTVDGSMGSQTAAAIRRYQLAKALPVDGKLNPPTLQSLGISPKPQAASAPVPPPTPVPEYVAIADLFKGGPYITAPPQVQIATIRQAQKTLKLLKYYQGPVDGSPNLPLVWALRAWQKDAGFRQTGRFDENTLKGLNIMPG